ncbi:MAG: 4-hydroxyproline epimerase [Rhodoferax sp.]
MEAITCVDSHTGGEPTRVVLSGFPDLGQLPLTDVVQQLRDRHDAFRRATVCEPRGNDVVVGALLLPPRQADSLASVVFFNNVGYLGMCGHGTIGLIATLEHLGRIRPGVHRIDTPVGTVEAELHGGGRVSVANVPAYRHRTGVALEVPGHGPVQGDVAWGGNWFFLCSGPGQPPLQVEAVGALTEYAQAIRRQLEAQGIRGANGAEIDHIELVGPAQDPRNSGRNFVLCPGGAYDRSPCGTGTSAKLACLAADGDLSEGTVWRQESVLGSVFEAVYRRADGQVLPTIRGRAHVVADLRLHLDADDPFCWGIGR